MPKGRYRIMADYMPKVGTRGLDMMFRTCTVQANLDYADETDMVRKLRVSLALQPVATALFANSPFTEGKPNGFLSWRSHVWLDTDNARSGMMAFAFEPGMGFERYVDYALDVPMYFVKRGTRYHDVTGMSFRDLLTGKLEAMPGERATLSDWGNPLSTIFPEVRLKRYLEMRGADVGSAEMITALGALFTGPALRRRGTRGFIRPRPALVDRGATGNAGRSRGEGLRHDRDGAIAARRRSRDPGDRSGRPSAARLSGRRGPGRNPIPGPAIRPRRPGANDGRKTAGALSRRLERQHRSALRGMRHLNHRGSVVRPNRSEDGHVVRR